MNIEEIQARLDKFAKDRDWDQFHNPKNLSMALSVEVAELVEIFQWSNSDGLNEIKDLDTRRKIEEENWNSLSANISFHAGPYDDLGSFEKLEEKISVIEKAIGSPAQCLFYVSTPPGVFMPILENLGASGLAKRHQGQNTASKVIIEKPFGRDLTSAHELNEVINRRFDESQVFRIDHYLGKETVQSLLVQRFANAISNPYGIDIMFQVFKSLFPKIWE